jgi:endonuclease YncB( thermonuclease family)
MSELQKLLRRKDRIRRLPGSGSVLQSLLLALLAAGGGFYFGASERGEALWDEYFGPRITWNQPIDPDEIRRRFASGLLEGRVTRVSDGDTVRVRLDSGQKFKIRLAEIDAPESCQPYGTQSTRLLSKLVMNQKVMIVLVDADRYGRLVGRIYVDTTDVSAELVAEGAARFNSEYAHDETLYLLEVEARDAKRGLWALPLDERIEPWVFRKQKSCR